MYGRQWERVALVGAATLLACAVVGYPYIQFAFQLAALLSVVMIIWGIRLHKPERKQLWYTAIVVSTMYGLSYGMRLLMPSMWPVSMWQPTPADWIDLIALVIAVRMVSLAGIERGLHRDPTTSLDAVIFAGCLAAVSWVTVVIPYARDPHFSPEGRALQIGAVVVGIALVFVGGRIAMSPTIKARSFTYLNLAGLNGLASNIAGTAEGTPEGSVCLLFGASALILLGLSATHPSMAPSVMALPRESAPTWRRFAAMAVALLVAPFVLAVREFTTGYDPTSTLGLVVVWSVVSILVMVRLAGLMRVRQRILHNERSLRDAAVKLASAATVDEIYETTIHSIGLVARLGGNVRRVAMLRAVQDEWVVTAAIGEFANETNGRRISSDVLSRCARVEGQDLVEVEGTLAPDVDDLRLCDLTLVAIGGGARAVGMLLVVTRGRLEGDVIDALMTMARNISLASDAVSNADQARLRESEARFQALVRNARDITAVIDDDGTIRYVTPSLSEVLGLNCAHALGSHVASLFLPSEAGVVDQLIRLIVKGTKSQTYAELAATKSNGEEKYLEVTVTDYRDDQTVGGLVFNAHDVTDRKRLENDLRHHVLHDSLTGLANRVLFGERVQHALRVRRNGEANVGVLEIDIDDFKTINDALGQQVGDELLKLIAFRIESFVRSGDTTSRLGNDVFAVVMENSSGVDTITDAAERLRQVLSEPIDCDGNSITLTASVGIATATSDMTNAEDLLRNVDVAMHRAKHEGKNRICVFDNSMRESVVNRMSLKAELGKAMERNEFELHYQPLIAIRDERIYGFEELIRLRHPERGLVPPNDFLPIVEESGQIIEIGRWVAREAMKTLKSWQVLSGLRDLRMNINISPRQLKDEYLADQLSDLASEACLEPHTVSFEITETGVVGDEDAHVLRALREFGFGLAADDFGTGYASYASLRQLPFTTVKIDRSLVQGITGSESGAVAQVRSIIEMGHALGMAITAEGVEERFELDTLLRLGADVGQGWLFSKALSRTDAEMYLTSYMRSSIPQVQHS